MADPTQVAEENVEGRFYVDSTCIACDTCVGIAPDYFILTSMCSHAYVWAQPKSKGDYQKCYEAMTACPVQAIGERE